MAGLYPVKDYQEGFATGAITYGTDGKFELRLWSAWLRGLITRFMSIGCDVGALAGNIWRSRMGTKYSVQLSGIWIIIGCTIKVTAMRSWCNLALAV